MFNMFNQIFLTISVLFAGLEKFAQAFNHLGGWSEETAGAFSDESAIKRKAARNAMLKKYEITEEQLKAIRDENKAPVPTGDELVPVANT